MNNMVKLVRFLHASLDWAAVRMNEVLVARQLQPVMVRVAARSLELRRITPALAMVASLSGFAGTASAEVWRHASETWADGRLVDVQVNVEGQATPLYWAPGHNDRRYLQALAGRNYSLVLRNNSARRVGVLLAVDGLNVVNGEITRLSNNEAMYVLGPWERTTIKGWRTNLQSIRRFKFVDEQSSYAERTGQANSDMGWIRVLAFREERGWNDRQRELEMRGDVDDRRYKDGDHGPRANRPVPTEEDGAMGSDERESHSQGVPAPSSKGEASRRSAQPYSTNAPESTNPNSNSFPGTGWGEKRHDPVTRVDFRAERRATDHLVLRYEYASGLRALGIFPNRNRLRERDGDVGFAKPPRW